MTLQKFLTEAAHLTMWQHAYDNPDTELAADPAFAEYLKTADADEFSHDLSEFMTQKATDPKFLSELEEFLHHLLPQGTADRHHSEMSKYEAFVRNMTRAVQVLDPSDPSDPAESSPFAAGLKTALRDSLASTVDHPDFDHFNQVGKLNQVLVKYMKSIKLDPGHLAKAQAAADDSARLKAVFSQG